MRPRIVTSVLGRFHFHVKISPFADKYVRFQKALNGSDAGMKNKRNQLFYFPAEKAIPTKNMALPSKSRNRWCIGADIFSVEEKKQQKRKP